MKSKKKYIKLNFLRPSDVTREFSISRSTIFRWIKEGKLPEPRRLTARVIGWSREDIESIFLGE